MKRVASGEEVQRMLAYPVRVLLVEATWDIEAGSCGRYTRRNQRFAESED